MFSSCKRSGFSLQASNLKVLHEKQLPLFMTETDVTILSLSYRHESFISIIAKTEGPNETCVIV